MYRPRAFRPLLFTAVLLLASCSVVLHQLSNYHFETKARCDLGLLHRLAGEYKLARIELREALNRMAGYGETRYQALASTRLGYADEAVTCSPR